MKPTHLSAIVMLIACLFVAAAVVRAEDRSLAPRPTGTAIVTAGVSMDEELYEARLDRLNHAIRAGDQVAINQELLAVVQLMGPAAPRSRPTEGSGGVNVWTELSDERSRHSF